jgi:hypothetical protein
MALVPNKGKGKAPVHNDCPNSTWTHSPDVAWLDFQCGVWKRLSKSWQTKNNKLLTQLAIKIRWRGNGMVGGKSIQCEPAPTNSVFAGQITSRVVASSFVRPLALTLACYIPNVHSLLPLQTPLPFNPSPLAQTESLWSTQTQTQTQTQTENSDLDSDSDSEILSDLDTHSDVHSDVHLGLDAMSESRLDSHLHSVPCTKPSEQPQCSGSISPTPGAALPQPSSPPSYSWAASLAQSALLPPPLYTLLMC